MHFRTSLAIIVAAVFTLTASSAQIVKWAARYDGPGQRDDVANAIAVDAGGNVYVTGFSDGGPGTGDDYCTIKYDTDGNQLWVQRYDSPGHYLDEALAIALDGSGNAYVTGFSGGDYCTIKYDTDGNQLWVQRYDGPSHNTDIAFAIAVDGSGNAYVTGYSDGGFETYLDYCTIKYDTDGNQLWVQRYDGPGHSVDEARAIAVDTTGNAYVTGFSDGGPGTGDDYCTIKYDTDGNQLWVQRYDGPGPADGASAIAVDATGNAYVTGSTGSAGDLDYCTIKYDTDGNQLWVQRYDGPGYYSEDYALAIAVDVSGNAYVTGYSGVYPFFDYCTIKYGTDGNQLWVQRYDDPGHGKDEAGAIAVDATGNVYITGYSFAGTGTWYDYCTIKYDANGNQLWVQRYDGPGDGVNAAYSIAVIAVDASGNAYVTGYSTNAEGDTDYLTIMYSRPTATMSGHVKLHSYVGGAGIVGTLEYRLPGTTQPIYSSQITLDVNGNYQDMTAPVGTFDLGCKFSNWLRQVLPSVPIGASGATAYFSLTNGDANGDNNVNLLDLSVVLRQFGTTGTPLLCGDLNWDGAVGLPDLSIVLANFGKTGNP